MRQKYTLKGFYAIISLCCFMMMAFVLVSCVSQSSAQSTQPVVKDPVAAFEREVERLRENYKIPGMSVAILQEQQVIFAGGFGYADIENKPCSLRRFLIAARHCLMDWDGLCRSIKGTKLVWHYGWAPKAYSSLILKVPAKEVTLILLANSDGASAPFRLGAGNVLRSPFAVAFLNLFAGANDFQR